MKKVLIALAILIMIFTGCVVYKNLIKEDENVSSVEETQSVEGLRIMLLSGSNRKVDSQEVNQSFIALTSSKELVIVDGGFNNENDTTLIKSLIASYEEDRQIDHWIITNIDEAHSGVLYNVLNGDMGEYAIKNLYINVPDLKWNEEYNKDNLEYAKNFLEVLENTRIVRKLHLCEEGKNYTIDNLNMEVLKLDLVNAKDLKTSSMVFKLTATDINRSMLFLSDYTGDLSYLEEKLNSDIVQVANHGDDERLDLYDKISPEVALFNCPIEMYLNQGKNGKENTGKYKTQVLATHLNENNIKMYLACDGDQMLHLKKDEIIELEGKQ